MALPADFSKIFGSTATGGLTPISDVNYAKGWEFVGSNPPTKNDFSYLQNLSDLKSQWLYSNKLQRTDPFGDIKSDGAAAISTALTNLGLGEAAKRAVGTGENQIPDMSSFPLTVTGDLSSRKLTTKLPNGLILKAVNGNADSNGWFSLNFDTPFPSEILFCWATDRLPVNSLNQISVINANINLSTVDHVAGYARAITSGGGVGPVAASISAYALGR